MLLHALVLTLSPPISSRLYTFYTGLTHHFNLTFGRFGAQEWSPKHPNGGLDQYGAGPLEQQQFGTAGVAERVKHFWQGIKPSCVFLLYDKLRSKCILPNSAPIISPVVNSVSSCEMQSGCSGKCTVHAAYSALVLRLGSTKPGSPVLTV